MTESSISYTDVLIIGAGPSGLMAAYWMARCGVNARIIDKRGTKVFTGQADGLRPRTLELLDSIGVVHRVLHEACEAAEFTFWGPGEDGRLKRQEQHAIHDLNNSPFGNCILNQGRIEHCSDLEVERGVIAESLEYDETLENSGDAYPITVTLRTLGEEEANPSSTHGGSGGVRNGLFRSNITPDDWDDLIKKSKERPGNVETVKAKYLIGCDGAHSWTRKELNIPFEGSTTEHIWGVVDMVPITNFPDIRRVCTVATEHGTLLVIPRERQLVRLYLPLQAVDGTSVFLDRSSITLDMVRQKAKEVLRPFDFDFKICDWWTVYQVGRRLASSFTKGRIHLAGDAIHTHSPKAGLGMNVSMQDGFNIGWKVALVAKGVARPSILATYELERKRTAQMLIDLDRRLQPLFVKEQQGDAAESTAPSNGKETLMDLIQLSIAFANGYVCYYGPSSLVYKGGEDIAAHLIPGERFPPAKIRNQADSQAWWTTRLFKSDGSFRIMLLAGDLRHKDQRQRVEAFSTHLASAELVLQRYTPEGEKLDSLIEVITIHSAPVREMDFSDFPEMLRLFDPERGWAYDKIWSDDDCFWDRQCTGKGYESWGVDRVRGALVILRPDQHIGWVGNIENVDEMTGYFEQVFQPPQKTLKVESNA
ncbi:putative phenol 2-monooxygenase [Aspergillus novofumigatus IBT 16806]|uniref:Putative phenol 2-monooxygenase n=1 Tax=Aspergillus novofumigatus (strain IBT 16806) TaxID=1392255 RepID=A0A2I1C8L6_ASPN1|nr:putative phenol 2-monooxygenase [Aspergillus novofumigatus IBT 16806]PKX93992.1 putative phenol 2-monooxygenase [Aspergillus novofumigatus IBT 16806]